MVSRFSKYSNKTGEISVFDRKKQKSVGGTFKAKNKHFAYKFSGRKAVLLNAIGTTKKSAKSKLDKYIKSL
jgi:hypothetical protein